MHERGRGRFWKWQNVPLILGTFQTSQNPVFLYHEFCWHVLRWRINIGQVSLVKVQHRNLQNMPIFHKKMSDILSLDMEMYITSVCKYCVTYFFSILEQWWLSWCCSLLFCLLSPKVRLTLVREDLGWDLAYWMRSSLWMRSSPGMRSSLWMRSSLMDEI